MQVCGRGLDVEVLVLGGADLGAQHAAAVHVLEVPVRKPVMPLRVVGLLVVQPEVPPRVRGEAVLLEELVLLGGGRAVLAPVVALVEDGSPFRDQLLGVPVRPVVQPDGHHLL